jgi:hypothetical protein
VTGQTPQVVPYRDAFNLTRVPLEHGHHQTNFHSNCANNSKHFFQLQYEAHISSLSLGVKPAAFMKTEFFEGVVKIFH